MRTVLIAIILTVPLGSPGLAWAQAAGAGVSSELARERASAITDLRYELALSIPRTRTAPVEGRIVIRFTLKSPRPVVLDFLRASERVRTVEIAGRPAVFSAEGEHLTLPANTTRAGQNSVAITFTAGDDALNRGDDFLYTLFVPARAHGVFPCFDQPDMKGRYTVTLVIPDGWKVVANAPEGPPREMIRGADGVWGDMVQFAETKPLPTYLVGFAAGRFTVETAMRDGRQIRMFHRETDAARVARNREAIFDLHAAAVKSLEMYTGVPYPFEKLDMVLIPSFQFGGMEHAGAIFYNASSLMLEASATQNQMLNRASTIAHETAHMWFGDLVTMRWFDDVWVKEVFANFMASKVVRPMFPDVNHELRFLLAHYPSAYQVDRTGGANPIRQPLENLDEAGQLYGPIIYDKAPIVMRQLERLMGEQDLRDGLREYLKRYAFGNASWRDLVRLLDDRTPINLARWSRDWVEEAGRPVVTTDVRLDERGRVRDITLTTTDPRGRGLVWPQQLDVAVGGARNVSARAVTVPVFVKDRRTRLGGVKGLERPLYVLPNGNGLGYGLFILDAESQRYLLQHVEDLTDPLTRGSAWVTLWDNMLEGRVDADVFVTTALRAVPHESDEQNTQRVLSYLTDAFWRFLPPETRARRAPAIEAVLRAGLADAPTASRKASWFNTLRDMAMTPASLDWLARVWRREETVPGLPLAEPDEITLALELAVRDVAGADDIVRAQLARTTNPDRKARLAFVLPALSSDPAERQAAFDRLNAIGNRRREPWVLESLRYLNHPLRVSQGARFIAPGLALLEEIQRTGDIFFPSRWMDATLWGYRSPEAASEVRTFLAEHPRYPVRLRWVILAAADDLFRMTR